MNDDNYLEDKDLVTISETIGLKLTQFSPHLQMTFTEVDCIEADFPNDRNRQNLEMLRRWRQDSEEPSKNILFKALYSDFRKDLERFYKSKHNYYSVPVDILTQKKPVKVLDYYVEPSFEVVRHSWKHETREKIEASCIYELMSPMFSKTCKHVYISGHAGIGKTTFAKMLYSLWCDKTHGVNANEKDKIVVDKLQQFHFLFYVSLRNVRTHCHVDEMIMNEIVNRLNNSHYDITFLRSVFENCRCLVILDGLDEWYHPEKCECETGPKEDVPRTESMRDCCYLYTARPWKLVEVNLENEQHKQHIEISGYAPESRKALARKVLQLAEIDDITRTRIQTNLLTMDMQNRFEDLIKIPIVFIHLICLLLDKRPIGDSRCAVFCNIIEFLLKVGTLKLRDIGKSIVDVESGDECKHVPENHIETRNTCKYSHVLNSLSKLAFTAFFTERREAILVMETELVETVVTEEQLKIFLHMGILTKCESEQFSEESHTYSFIHKIFHEFFSARYIAYFHKEECIDDKIYNYVTSLKTSLEMENVFIFLCGLDYTAFSSISEKLQDIVAEDSVTQDYRRRIRFWFDVENEQFKYLHYYQSMNIACIKEANVKGEQQAFICNEDVFIDQALLKNGFADFGKLFDFNKKNVKSVSISVIDKQSFNKAVHMLNSDRIKDLVKLDINAESDEDNIKILLNGCKKTLVCLSVSNYSMGTEGSVAASIKLDSCFQPLLEMKSLKSLTLECFNATHEQLRTLTSLLNEKKEMTEIRLLMIRCVDHDKCASIESSCGFELDLSEHYQLHSFALEDAPVSNIKIPESLEECYIGQCASSEIETYIINSLTSENEMHGKQMQLFACAKIKNIEQCLKAASTMVNLVQLTLRRVDLTTVPIDTYLTKLSKLRKICLLVTPISTEILVQLVEHLNEEKNHPVAVRVEVMNCEVQDENKTRLQSFIAEIETTYCCRILQKFWRTPSKGVMFTFETKKI